VERSIFGSDDPTEAHVGGDVDRVSVEAYAEALL
jgi:hypothetical protein